MVFIGVALVIVGALLGGTFALPSKYGKEYPWEMAVGVIFPNRYHNSSHDINKLLGTTNF
ncbi:MAG: hypothetical protein WKG06_10055 [Segetibacter sp.]